MNKVIEKTHFGKEHAVNYDKHWSKLSLMNESLHFLTNIVLMDIPKEANILCIGVGTGAELFALAEKHPKWHFTAVDTSGAMLEVCKEKAIDAGILNRCEFFEGELKDLPYNRKYQVATSILVSQFILEREARVHFFKEIYNRLQPEGYLVTADLVWLENKNANKELLETWFKMQIFAGISEEMARASTSAWDKHVSISKASEIEDLIFEAGFANPIHFSKSFFINSWYAIK